MAHAYPTAEIMTDGHLELHRGDQGLRRTPGRQSPGRRVRARDRAHEHGRELLLNPQARDHRHLPPREPQHLHRYLGEFYDRYNARKIKDAQRAVLAVQGAAGKAADVSATTKSESGRSPESRRSRGGGCVSLSPHPPRSNRSDVSLGAAVPELTGQTLVQSTSTVRLAESSSNHLFALRS